MVGLPVIEAKSNFNLQNDTFIIGTLQPGETTGYLQLKAPSYPVVLEGSMLLIQALGFSSRQTLQINIFDNVIITPTVSSPNCMVLTNPPKFYHILYAQETINYPL